MRYDTTRGTLASSHPHATPRSTAIGEARQRQLFVARHGSLPEASTLTSSPTTLHRHLTPLSRLARTASTA